MANPLVGKFFIGVHDWGMRSGIVEAAIDDRHYLIRFDNVAGVTNDWPTSMGIASIEAMIGSPSEDDPPAWNLFDTEEQRSKYTTWVNQEPEGGPRIVRLNPKDSK